MKKCLALVVAIAFAAGAAGFAVAQTSTPQAAPKAEEKKGEKAAEMMKKMPVKNANGVVKSAAADSIVVAGKERTRERKDAEWTFAVDPKTVIRKGGKSITAADLKAGDLVHVRYMEMDGKAHAQAITVRAGGALKKDAANPGVAAPAEKK